MKLSRIASVPVRTALCVAFVGGLFGLPVTTSAQSKPGAPASARPRGHFSTTARHANQRKLLDLINAGRKKHGVKPLTLSLKESRCSAAHSRSMAAAGQLSHGLPGDLCVTYTTAGENIGYNPGYPATALITMNNEMWAEGPCPTSCPAGSSEWAAHGHYLNLVDKDFKTIGIGVMYSNGNTWLTEDFTGVS